MEFVYFTLQKDVFPRFDNASTKSLELQSRYNSMLCKSKREIVKANQSVRLFLCKKRDEIDFPVELDCFIAETVKVQNFDRVKCIKSRNINSFLKSQEESDSCISVLVADIKVKREIDKLGPTKFHFVLVAEDAHVKTDFEEGFIRHDKPIITIASKETLSREIDNLLERISLAPLKVIGESCYEKFQQSSFSADMSNGSRNVKSSNLSLLQSKALQQYNRNGLTYAEEHKNNDLQNTKSSDSYPSSLGHVYNKTEKKTELLLMPRRNGSAVPRTLKQSLRTGTTKTSFESNSTKESLHTSKIIYTRSKTNQEPGCLLNGLTDRVSSTSERKGIKRVVRQRSVQLDTSTAHKDKRRRKEREGSDQIGLSDTEYQSPSSGNTNEEENPERLLEAILAVYGMSNVPEAERPNVPKQSCVVSKEMRNELFKICPTIKGMGYRYRTFYIYGVKPKSQRADAYRRTQICSVLKRYGICHFKIASCADKVTELIHVGAEIEVRPRIGNGGTLGCFVNMNDGEGQCGLLSKHVTHDLSDVYYVGQGKERKIGNILQDTNKHQDRGLDISAALMREHIDENGTKFKDTRQTLLKGQLLEYNEEVDDAICRSGQLVHIYGAKSNPGRGEITMPCVDMGLSTPLIQVEDQISGNGTVKEHFAERGDSGAIVCVEDPEGKKVHALSMVMGTVVNETARKKYLTIPLSKGLEQLEENTGKTFKLC